MSLYSTLYWYAVHIYLTYDQVEHRLRFSRVDNKSAPPGERKNMSVAKAVSSRSLAMPVCRVESRARSRLEGAQDNGCQERGATGNWCGSGPQEEKEVDVRTASRFGGDRGKPRYCLREGRDDVQGSRSGVARVALLAFAHIHSRAAASLATRSTLRRDALLERWNSSCCHIQV